MQVDDDVWLGLRRCYETAEEPLKNLARRFGVSVQRIAARAKREGWTARRSERKLKTSKTAPAARARKPRSAGLPTRGVQRAVISRLFRAIRLKLEHMETRMASGEARSAQDEERENRALATMISNFEKVAEAVADFDKDRDVPRAEHAAGADAERMRREIAERLERLGGLGPAQRAPGGS